MLLGETRRAPISLDRKRRKVAASLQLHKVLYLPKWILVEPNEDGSSFVNPNKPEKVYWKSSKEVKKPYKLYTRNYDDSEFECTGMDKRIRLFQGLVHDMVRTRLPRRAVRSLRRLAIVFGSIPFFAFKRIVYGLHRILHWSKSIDDESKA